MSECLVTKLKSSVEDKNLKYFNAIRFFVYWSVSSAESLDLESVSAGVSFGGEDVTVRVLSNGYIIDSNGQNVGTEYVSTNGKAKYVLKPNSTAELTEFLLIGLADIVSLTTTSIPSSITTPDTEMFKYCNLKSTSNLIVYSSPSSFEAVDISYVKDLKNKESVTGIKFNQVNKNVKGDIVAFSDFTNTTTISGLSGNTAVVGNVSAFSKMKGLTSLDFSGTGISGNIASLGTLTDLTTIICYSSKIDGTLESLIASFIANGRTSGELSRVNLYNTFVTYNGSPLSGNHKVTWDESGNITLTSL